MSRPATEWALKQRGLKPATRVVLWALADCHNPSHGCFPSQAHLAEVCEMSRSTINLHLDILEERGLIRREASVDERTKRHRPTRYDLAIDEAVSEIRTDTVSEIETRPVSEKQPEPCPKNGQSRVRISDTNLVIEPVKEPVKEKSARDALADVVGFDLADAFVGHRKALRKPMTGKAGELLAKRLAQMRDPVSALQRSIENGWQGVFEKEEPSGKASPTLDRIERAARRVAS